MVTRRSKKPYKKPRVSRVELVAEGYTPPVTGCKWRVIAGPGFNKCIGIPRVGACRRPGT